MRKTIVRMLTLSITAILLLSGCGKGDNRTEEGKDNQVESITNTPEPTPTEVPEVIPTEAPEVIPTEAPEPTPTEASYLYRRRLRKTIDAII